jgi:hypothetical protein
MVVKLSAGGARPQSKPHSVSRLSGGRHLWVSSVEQFIDHTCRTANPVSNTCGCLDRAGLDYEWAGWLLGWGCVAGDV